MSNVNIEEQLDTDRVVCPVVRPLVLLVRAAHQRPLQVVHVGGAGVVEVPAAGLPRSRTRGRPAIILFYTFIFLEFVFVPVMRSLRRIGPEAADVAVSSVTKSVVHLLLGKLERLLGLDAEESSLGMKI